MGIKDEAGLSICEQRRWRRSRAFFQLPRPKRGTAQTSTTNGGCASSTSEWQILDNSTGINGADDTLKGVETAVF
jgi:hypothetical protein